MIDLSNKTAIITGSGRGIGKVIAKRLASFGANIFISDINQASIATTISELKKDFPKLQIEGYYCDVSQFDSIVSLSDYFFEKFPSIEILINNAGITKDNLLIRMKQQEWQDVIDINLTGIFNCTQVFSKAMIKQKKTCLYCEYIFFVWSKWK